MDPHVRIPNLPGRYEQCIRHPIPREQLEIDPHVTDRAATYSHLDG